MIPRPTIILAFVAFSLGMLVGTAVMRWRAGAELASVKAEHATQVANAASAAQAADSAQRRIEQRRVTEVMEVADAAHARVAQVQADADRARRAADELRRAYLALAAGATAAARPDSATAAGGPPTAGPGLVLPELFGRGDELLRSCAAALDRSRSAGLACERSYDAVRAADGP